MPSYRPSPMSALQCSPMPRGSSTSIRPSQFWAESCEPLSLPRRPQPVCALGPRPGRWARSKSVAPWLCGWLQGCRLGAALRRSDADVGANVGALCCKCRRPLSSSVCALIVCTHLARSQSREIASRTDWSVPSSWQPLGRLPSSNPSGLPSYSHRRPDSYTTDLPVENNDEASTYAECAGERCLSRCTASRGKYKKAWESLDAAVVASVHILVTVNVTY